MHHCLLSTRQRATASQSEMQMGVPLDKCPYFPRAFVASHPNLLDPRISSFVFASLVSHPTGIAQTESRRRISCDRSRQKRGPPTSISL